MPKNKDFKRRVRARMTKTGEAYTAARSQLLKKKSRSTASATPAADFAALAGMSNEAVRAKTGRTWPEWVRTLDAVHAASMPHRDIARHVHEEHDIPGWWAQTVTVGYERIRGLREVGQRRGGTYEASKSKTLPVSVTRLYRAFSSKRTRDRWLPGAQLEVRKSTVEKSMRITWSDETSVEVYFTPKGRTKSQVAVQHKKLPSKSEATRIKRYWSERLEALAGLLTSPSRRS